MNSFLNAKYWIVTLFIPVILILSTVRIMLTPLYIQIEYRLPGFPEDRYGFTFGERLYWAEISRQYLLNKEGIEFLADQKLDEDMPLYNERELRHMYDVKVVVRQAMIVLYGSIVLVVFFGYWAKRASEWQRFRLAVSRGGWLTVFMILLVFIYISLNFNSLFTNFHRIFFEGNTWLFKFSDSLIRLFPLRFWRDAFIWIGSVTLTSGAVIGYEYSKPKE